MPAFLITDDEIAALSPQQRRELIWRLARPLTDVVGPAYVAQRLRRRRLQLMIAAAAALVPWTVYLGVSLPDRYVARNWSLTWVGFDVLLMVMFALTVLLGVLRRQLLVLAAFASGLLLLCDAWFDITTAGPGDVWFSIATAVFAEIPIAILLISSALRLIRLLVVRLWVAEPGMRLWQVPILLSNDTEGDADR